MKVDKFVSVISPLYNNEDSVLQFIDDTISVLKDNYTNYELVLVDDNSRDKTVELVISVLDKYEGIRLLRLSREFGEEIAITAGLESVIGDFTVVMLPHIDPQNSIPEMVQYCMNGSDIVYGVRATPANENWFARKVKDLFFWYANRVLKLGLMKNVTQFSCMSRQAVNAIIQIKDSYRYLRLSSSLVGYDRKPIIYEPIKRGRNSRERSFFKTLNIALTLIVENSTHPLRFVSWLGLFAALSNLIYMVYIVFIYLFKDDVMPGWTTLSLQNGSQFFIIALILTALCEYTGRVLNRLQNRPLYYQKNERNSSLLLTEKDRPNIVEESVSTDVLSD